MIKTSNRLETPPLLPPSHNPGKGKEMITAQALLFSKLDLDRRAIEETMFNSQLICVCVCVCVCWSFQWAMQKRCARDCGCVEEPLLQRKTILVIFRVHACHSQRMLCHNDYS